VLDVVDGEQLAISWADARSDKPSEWVVSWTLRREGTRRRVILRHSGLIPMTPFSSARGRSWAMAASVWRPGSARWWAPNLSGAASRPAPNG
jgi:hypothetical protein